LCIAEEVVLDSEVLSYCREAGFRELDDAIAQGIQIEDVMDLFPDDSEAVERNCREIMDIVLTRLHAILGK